MVTINIRNMVCRHCAAAVREILTSLGLNVADVRIGSADIAAEALSPARLAEIDSALRSEGFELIADPAVALAERIKEAVRHHVRDEQECRLNLSACLEGHLGQTYDHLSRTFSSVEGRTIEKYYLTQRVELVKELMGYGELTLSEIADRVGYSSVAHLSRQFKEVTGLTPTQFRLAGSPRADLSQV